MAEYGSYLHPQQSPGSAMSLTAQLLVSSRDTCEAHLQATPCLPLRLHGRW